MSAILATGAPTWPPPALTPAGPFAEPLAQISWVMLALGGAVLLVVLALLIIAIARGKTAWLGGKRAVIIGGFAFPVVFLSAALLYGLSTTARLSEPPGADDLRIRVIGEMWWWRVLYMEGDRVAFETANEIHIPVGAPVAIELESADVIHSFWVPQLGTKLDMIPGRRNVMRLQADEAGVFRGHCTEFCGAAHALMSFEVVASAPADFEAWRARETRQVASAEARGEQVFTAAGCATCHAVSATDIGNHVGPNLAHVATRRTLGGGILPNDAATLRQWITDADALKPGVRMPSYETLHPSDREAVARYLESLR